MMNRFTERAQEALQRAQQIMFAKQHTQLDVEHVFLALLQQRNSLPAQIITRLEGDVQTMTRRIEAALNNMPSYGAGRGNATTGYITLRAQRVLQGAAEEADRLNDEFISTEHLLLAIANERGGKTAAVLQEAGIDQEKIYTALREIRGDRRVTDQNPEEHYEALERFSHDLTKMAREDLLDPIIGRADEIRRVMQVLVRRTKNNPVLIGEPGVGKTAIAEGLAQLIANDDVPELLRGKRVLALDLPAMVAGSKFRGEFEERLKTVMEEIKRAQKEIILFIDELHTVVGAGAAEGALDASNILKPALARGELQCIGATTLDEYRKIEKDQALERRFAPVYVDQPSVDEAILILRGLKPRYEAHHNLQIKDEAIVAAVNLSSRYITDRFLPDKAIDLMDEAASKVRLEIFSLPPDLREMESKLKEMDRQMEDASSQQEYAEAMFIKSQKLALQEEYDKERAEWFAHHNINENVDEEDVADVVSKWTGIPVKRMVQEEMSRLLDMETELHKRVVGQQEAIEAVSDAIRRARSGLRDARRPMGSFIFVGPTGVGKTELAKALADYLFDSEDAIVRVDMSEYGERHTVARMIGSPPGYVGYDEGGQLTESVRRRPYQVVLFDEIEKAHPEVFNALLQVLDDGRLTDGHGRTVDFSNTLIIMTSNVGTEFVPKHSGFGFLPKGFDETDHSEVQKRVDDALKSAFRPEFINRFDDIIVFHHLTLEELTEIVDIQAAELARRLATNGVGLRLSQAAKEHLAEVGYDRTFGARPLRRAIQRELETPLSKRLLKGDISPGHTVVAEFSPEDGITFTVEEPSEAPQPVEAEAQA
ncbi:MAG: ATP-dependent Clp protease ATP-binding subunit [Chloroflexia bacterium]